MLLELFAIINKRAAVAAATIAVSAAADAADATVAAVAAAAEPNSMDGIARHRMP